MNRRRKLTFASAAAVGLVVAGLGAAGAIGASRVLSSSDESKAVIDDVAAQLGVEPSALSDALKEALENRIDDALADGRLSAEQAQRLRERLDSQEYPQLFGGGHHGFGHRGFSAHLGFLDEAASYLGISVTELRDELRDKTLAEIAREQGKSASALVDRLVATQTKRIDEAVADGRLTDEQAAELKEGVEARMQVLVDGELRHAAEHGHRFWPRSGSPRGPPSHGGPPG